MHEIARRRTSSKWCASVVVMATVLMVGAACNSVSGSGNVVTRQIDVTPFTELEISNAFAVSITVGSSERAAVRVDDNLVDSLDIRVDGDTLHIGLQSRTDAIDATLEADVTVRSLSRLEGSGASTITFVDPIEATTLVVTLSGTSELAGPVRIGEGSLELSGASNVGLSGSATTLEITGSGASRVGTQQLTIEDLTIDLSGGSNAEVTVTGSLAAAASGGSTLRFAGSPTIARSDASDASTIEPLG
jgi:hypothetical protein